MLHAALHLTDHARADIVAIDTAAALAAPGVEAVLTADDLPGELRVGIIHKDWPVMIPVGGRTSYAGDVLAIVVADTRDQARAAAHARRGRLRRAHADHRRPRRARRHRAAVGVGHRRQRAVDQRLHPRCATSTRPSRRARSPCTRRSRPSASSTPSSSRSRPWRSRPGTTESGPSTCTPAARACGTTATTSPPCSASTRHGSRSSWSPTAARSAARRT